MVRVAAEVSDENAQLVSESGLKMVQNLKRKNNNRLKYLIRSVVTTTFKIIGIQINNNCFTAIKQNSCC
jgi:hypothetical protein